MLETSKLQLLKEMTIYLEHTIADVVRENNVTIGPEISVVEYHTSFNQKGNTVVRT